MGEAVVREDIRSGDKNRTERRALDRKERLLVSDLLLLLLLSRERVVAVERRACLLPSDKPARLLAIPTYVHTNQQPHTAGKALW